MRLKGQKAVSPSFRAADFGFFPETALQTVPTLELSMRLSKGVVHPWRVAGRELGGAKVVVWLIFRCSSSVRQQSHSLSMVVALSRGGQV
jgi:hypothetical protein